MRKTSVYLTEDEADDLRRLAGREGRSQAELIRDGVRRVIDDAERKPRELKSLGKGRGGGQPYRRWGSQDLYDRSFGHE